MTISTSLTNKEPSCKLEKGILDEEQGLDSPFCQNLDKILEKNDFQILDKKQHKTVIPEKKLSK